MKIPTRSEVAAFKIGTKVTTEYYSDQSTVVRRITSIEKGSGSSSGYLISTDGGEPCVTCNHPAGKVIHSIDGVWFNRVK